MKKFNKKGFTLVEMLVVIAIIAILVSIIIPTVSSSTVKANAAADAANLRSVTASVATQYLGNGTVSSVPSVTCKSVSGKACSVEVYDIDGAIESYFVVDSKYYSLDSFVTVAQNGGEPAAETTNPAAANKIYPAAAKEEGK